MADYIKREDLINKLHTLCKINCAHYPHERDIYCDMCELGDVIKLIKGCPTADVIPAPTTTFISGLVIEGEPTEYKPVVRCKKCSNWARADGQVYGSCSIDALIRNEDFWCANGVENDDGEDVEGWTELNTMTITGMS